MTEPKAGPGWIFQFVVVWLALTGLGTVLLLAGIDRFEHPEVSCVPSEPGGTCRRIALSPGGHYEQEVTLEYQVLSAKVGAVICFIVPGAAILTAVLGAVLLLLLSLGTWVAGLPARFKRK